MSDFTGDWDNPLDIEDTQPRAPVVTPQDTQGDSDGTGEIGPDVTRNDRFNAVLVPLIFVIALVVGLYMRQSTSSGVWPYVSQEAGIEASYPAGWLFDETSNDYVVRLSDPASRPFKTQFIIRVVPASQFTSVRNVLDELTIQRSVELSAYRVLNVENVVVNDVEATQMNFVFVNADPDPFSQRVPAVVLGTDIVIIDEGRAITVTFMSSEETYQENLSDFQRFLSSLRY